MERKMANLSTSRVTITNHQGSQKEILNKEEIEKCILQANKRKYHQTEGTGQLQRGQLLQDLGTMGTRLKVQNVLTGSYTTPMGTKQETKQFIRMMKKLPQVQEIPPFMFSKFVQGWEKAKERTSSAGPHFGHYKASLSHPKIAKLYTNVHCFQ
jgi:hypothetical protein